MKGNRFLFIVMFFFLGIQLSAQKITAIKAVDLEKIIASSTTPLVINFWATWCAPCIEEIPYFQEIVKEYRKDSVRLILVSLDIQKEFPKGIQKIADKREFKAPIMWLNETNADYFCPKVDSSWSGAIPATLFINNKTGYRNFFEEQLSREKLTKEIMALLQSDNKTR